MFVPRIPSGKFHRPLLSVLDAHAGSISGYRYGVCGDVGKLLFKGGGIFIHPVTVKANLSCFGTEKSDDLFDGGAFPRSV